MFNYILVGGICYQFVLQNLHPQAGQKFFMYVQIYGCHSYVRQCPPIVTNLTSSGLVVSLVKVSIITSHVHGSVAPSGSSYVTFTDVLRVRVGMFELSDSKMRQNKQALIFQSFSTLVTGCFMNDINSKCSLLDHELLFKAKHKNCKNYIICLQILEEHHFIIIVFVSSQSLVKILNGNLFMHKSQTQKRHWNKWINSVMSKP